MPPIKAIVTDLNQVDPKHQDLYVKTENGYTLDVDGTDYDAKLKEMNSKVNEFRNNNVQYVKENEKVKQENQSLKTIDPEKYREMEAKLEKIEEEKLVKAGKQEEVYNLKVEKYRQKHEKEFADYAEKLDKEKQINLGYKKKLDDIAIKDAVLSSISEQATIKPKASVDVLSRAYSVWKVDENGELGAFNNQGEVMLDNDTRKPLTLEKWSSNFINDVPHLFEKNTGGSSKGNQSPASNLKNVMYTDDPNFADKHELILTDEIQGVYPGPDSE